ncbi:MAG: class II aldolase/adducin family protein [Candidatus Cloacimonetes bacterium]|nr:class II aldolase/adducin family protein [Candidatus Cloacimonadota bacterium]
MPADLNALSARLPGLMEELRAVAQQINLRGWAEANAGNVSVNVTAEAAGLFGGGCQWYLVSRGGSRYRQMASDPLPQLLLARVDANGEEHFPPSRKPSSEWGCHKLLQQHFLATGSEDRVVLHAHPNSIIMLSQLDLYNNETAVNSLLRESLAELALFLPDGIATAPAAPPGSQELAECSLKAIGKRRALIWQGHGLVCTGRSLNEALDHLEVVEKAAAIALHRIILTKIAT